MMTRQEIQADLREIRYYYSMKEMFDKSADTVKPLAIIEKVNRYNKAMDNAPAKMLALYLSLYVYNNSQAVIAEDWHLTRESIKNQNRLLQEYLQSSL